MASDGVPFAKECEAIALEKAIIWLAELGFQRVVFETNTKQVVDAINSSAIDHTEFRDIIARCRLLLSQQDSYSVKFVRRKTNVVAHTLAHKSRFTACPSFYYDLPNFLIPVMDMICPIEAN